MNPWPRWIKAEHIYIRITDGWKLTKTGKKKNPDNVVKEKLHTHICFLYPDFFLFLGNSLNKRDKTTRDDQRNSCAPTLTPTPILILVSAAEAVKPGLYMWRDGDGAAVFLIEILLHCVGGRGLRLRAAICFFLLLGHKEAQCRAEETEWSSQVAEPRSRGQIARRPGLTFPSSNGALGGLGSGWDKRPGGDNVLFPETYFIRHLYALITINITINFFIKISNETGFLFIVICFLLIIAFFCFVAAL